MQNGGRIRADPFIAADTFKEVFCQLAAFTIVHLNAKDELAPHIQHHIEVEELTLDRARQQGNILGHHLLDARCIQHGWLSWLSRGSAPAAMIQQSLLAQDAIDRRL